MNKRWSLIILKKSSLNNKKKNLNIMNINKDSNKKRNWVNINKCFSKGIRNLIKNSNIS